MSEYVNPETGEVVEIIVGKRRHSKTLGAFFAALAKAQGEMAAAKKDSVNPHFKSKYADLASVWDACREPLSKNGIAVVQSVVTTSSGVEIETMLGHSSGEYMASPLEMPLAQRTVQTFGSAITYGRRYSLAAAVGVAPDEDDDGNAAGVQPPSPPPVAGRKTAEVKNKLAAKSARIEDSPKEQTAIVAKEVSDAAKGRIRELAKTHGLDDAVLKSRIWGALRKTSADLFTDADVATFEASLTVVSKPKKPDVAQPSDEVPF